MTCYNYKINFNTQFSTGTGDSEVIYWNHNLVESDTVYNYQVEHVKIAAGATYTLVDTGTSLMVIPDDMTKTFELRLNDLSYAAHTISLYIANVAFTKFYIKNLDTAAQYVTVVYAKDSE